MRGDRATTAGKAAPELAVKDLSGIRSTLCLQGKDVLLDSDERCVRLSSTRLELDNCTKSTGSETRGDRISVDEERAVAEGSSGAPTRLSDCADDRKRPVNPRTDRVFPTYVVIDKNGAVVSAMQGDRILQASRDPQEGRPGPDSVDMRAAHLAEIVLGTLLATASGPVLLTGLH